MRIKKLLNHPCRLGFKTDTCHTESYNVDGLFVTIHGWYTITKFTIIEYKCGIYVICESATLEHY